MVDQDGKSIWYHAEKAKYLQRTNHTMESQERLIAHIERRFREEQDGRRDAKTRLGQAKDELDKAKKTSRSTGGHREEKKFWKFTSHLDKNSVCLYSYFVFVLGEVCLRVFSLYESDQLFKNK
ncbi:hypothetical protein BpHYR1_034092 [Brachionus plicatilis]|uniref:Uncharacterized protein n=1 Tax=Brachionus plicatilis TaxID=10195 RepID=A0A3M7PJX6_BRAPC|nr:hypothetical protein BpHYR1_034092 [Brachionus plicatilis]